MIEVWKGLNGGRQGFDSGVAFCVVEGGCGVEGAMCVGGCGGLDAVWGVWF